MNAYTTAEMTTGVDASASAGIIPVPATFAAGAMIEKIATPTADPTPSDTTSIIVRLP